MRLIALLLVFVSAPVAAQMYKCTNERGVVQYTDKPSAGCKEIDIRPSPPISGALEPKSDDLGRQEAEFRKRQIDRDASLAKDRQAQAERCTKMRRELTLLNTSRRVVRANERGEREFMDDAARDQRVADLQREVARCP